jgi:uncharacterized membrane protein
VQRLVQFSDGVFTVALTLLVINIAVPTLPNGSTETALVAQLSSQVPNILAFVLTFWVVGSYWLTHHRHFLLIHRYDGPLLLLNLLFLMTVCFIPWPTAVLGHYGNSFAVWALYALSMAAMGIATTAMWVYASNRPSLARCSDTSLTVRAGAPRRDFVDLLDGQRSAGVGSEVGRSVRLAQAAVAEGVHPCRFHDR